MGTSFNPIRVYTTNPSTNAINPEFVDQPELKDDFQKIKEYFLMLNSIPKPEIEDKSLNIKMQNFFMQMFPLAKHATDIFIKAEEESKQDKAIKDLVADAVYETEDGDEYNHLKLRRTYDKSIVDEVIKMKVGEEFIFPSGSWLKRIN